MSGVQPIVAEPILPMGGQGADVTERFISGLLGQLSLPGRQVFPIRTPRGRLEVSRPEALRLLRTAQRIVRLHRARERLRARLRRESP